MTTQDNEPVIVRFYHGDTPERRKHVFERMWEYAFGSLRNPATRTIAIVEERDE